MPLFVFRFTRLTPHSKRQRPQVNARVGEPSTSSPARARGFGTLNPLVKEALQEVVSKEGNAGLNKADVKETVEKAVKEAVRE